MSEDDKLAVKYIWHWCLECNTMGVPSVMHQRFCRFHDRSLGETHHPWRLITTATRSH